MRAERRAMNANRNFLSVVLVFVAKVKASRLREIDLVGRNRKLAADDAPNLDVNLRSVECRLVGHLDVINAGILENVARHVLGLLPKLGLVDELLSEFRRIVG